MAIFSRMHQLRAPWMAWWLALALVVAPALGRMHEVLHAPGLPLAHAALTSLSSSTGAPHDVHALFGDHSIQDCLAFDQLSHGMGGDHTHAVLVHILAHGKPVWNTDPAALPVADALFYARAPPRVTV